MAPHLRKTQNYLFLRRPVLVCPFVRGYFYIALHVFTSKNRAQQSFTIEIRHRAHEIKRLTLNQLQSMHRRNLMLGVGSARRRRQDLHQSKCFRQTE